MHGISLARRRGKKSPREKTFPAGASAGYSLFKELQGVLRFLMPMFRCPAEQLDALFLICFHPVAGDVLDAAAVQLVGAPGTCFLQQLDHGGVILLPGPVQL